LLLFAVPVFAQEQKVDIDEMSKSVFHNSAVACNALINAFDKGELLIKEQKAQIDAQGKLIAIQEQQIETLKSANAKLEQANAALQKAFDLQAKSLALAEEQHKKDTEFIASAEKRRRKKGKLVSALKIGAGVGATVACGPICGVAAYSAIEVFTIIKK
jgi:cell division protein FtsB